MGAISNRYRLDTTLGSLSPEKGWSLFRMLAPSLEHFGFPSLLLTPFGWVIEGEELANAVKDDVEIEADVQAKRW